MVSVNVSISPLNLLETAFIALLIKYEIIICLEFKQSIKGNLGRLGDSHQIDIINLIIIIVELYPTVL